MTQTSRPVFSRFYARLAGPGLERAGAGEQRDRMLAGLRGEVIELGAGNGLNFPHYPADVTRVVAVEPERHLREMAERAAGAVSAPIEVVAGSAEALPYPDGSFDAAVASLVLCSVPEPWAALRELRRVLRPGGELRFFEHVRAASAGERRLQDVLDSTFWPRLMGGCHTGRDTAGAIEAAGFTVTELHRFRFPETGVLFPTADHVRGTAVA
ncbi:MULTISPECIES: class I SAM-dependent methyltransferase [unclassified Streptomyces]|uniref:class I SAM-dependent methyltransferase n=1 Tax=unclassified Streptomyces TaxID=2593676 RepID=UPI0022B6CCEC|nr:MULTISPECIES: class I SAM-dependent methyltransferase [unclassified Streptomyces]MCZ7416496.1 class I SAM-dependent methyltransferase [Streptomyces sp. WMMC897]MCZ7433693.1 class I SAM-dependent methyltransferase [Streptomyces sp. WMMC1477]